MKLKEFEAEKIEVLESVISCAEEMGIPIVMIGASARDIRRICSENTDKKLTKLLENQTKDKGYCLFNQDLRKHCYGEFQRAKELTYALYEGFKEGK